MATNTGKTQIRQNINARSQYVFTGGKIISATKENHSPNGQQPAPPVGFAKNLFDKTLFIFERNFAHSLEKPFPAHLLPVLMAMFPSRCRHKRFAGVQGMSDKRRTPVNRKLCGRGASAIMHRETGQMMAFALRRAARRNHQLGRGSVVPRLQNFGNRAQKTRNGSMSCKLFSICSFFVVAE